MIKNKGIDLYVFKEDFQYIEDKANDIDIDSPEYAYALLKVLNKADKIGAFDTIKPDPDTSDEGIETIYV